MFAATADFVTNSQIYVYDSNNTQIADFTAGVTTNKIVFDIRLESVSIQESLNNNHKNIKHPRILSDPKLFSK